MLRTTKYNPHLRRYCPRRNHYWINSGKGGSCNFKAAFTGINSLIIDSSNLSSKKSKFQKLVKMIVHSRQGLSRNKISNSSEIESAIILVPTVRRERGSFAYSSLVQKGPGTQPETVTFGLRTVCPETGSTNGAAGATFQEPRADPESYSSAHNSPEIQTNPFLKYVRTENRKLLQPD